MIHSQLPHAGRLTLFLLLAVLSTGLAHAQTGKLVGRVTEAGTGETLPGVNVLIEGTTQGTATNLDGEFVIIGVRPGLYTVQASFIGFSTRRQEGVQVSVDLTTTVNFALAEEIFEGEEIVVTAEAIGVRKDVTSSEARVTAETLDRLPVTELGQVLDVQAGITTRGGLHVRGGRASEVVFMVDGVPVSDAYDGSSAVQLENAGIQELQVISGTFNAEYGNAMSGVINVVTKEGGSKYAGAVQVYTGSYAVSGSGGEDFLTGRNVEEQKLAGIQYRDVDPYSYLPLNATQFYNAQLSLEGPIVGDRITFFGLGRYFSNDGWMYGANIYDQNGGAGDSSIVAMNNFERYSYQGNIRMRLSRSLILNLIGLGSSSQGRGYSLYRRWSPEGRGFSYDKGYDVKAKLTHLLSATTFYTFNVGTYTRTSRYRLYDDPLDNRYNGFDLAPPDSIDINGTYETVLTGFGRYARGGTDLGRFNRTTRTYLAKGDMSSQIGKHHLVKGGFQVKLDQLDFTSFSLQPGIDGSGAVVEPFQPAIPDAGSSAFTTFQDFNPITLSAYVQDKIEFEDFIVNAGIRYDYFDSRAQLPADPSDPNIFNPLSKLNRYHDTDGDGIIQAEEESSTNEKTIADREVYWWQNAKGKSQISPRLGVAYPITEQGVIHFSYGIFFQIPTMDNLSANFGYKIPNSTGTHGPYGNPDLDAQKTTMYEIGLKQGFGPFVIDVTGYYRDVRSWVSTSPVILTVLPGVSYVVYTNRDYANTRGVTVSLSRKFRDGYQFDLAYTYQVVEGSASNPAEEFFSSVAGTNEPTLALLPLDWDQRQKLAGSFYAGGDNWGGSLRFRLESGFPYTPSFAQAALVGNDVQPEFPRNSRLIPASFELDINIFKQLDLGKVRPRIFIEIFNLLDARNVNSVFSDTGEPDVTLDQLRTGQFDPGYFVRPNHYVEPRRIQLGLEFRF